MGLLRSRDDRWDGTERRRPASVLVVNDGAARELLVRFLGHAGVRAEGVANEIEAMARIPELLPRCVLLDLSAGGVGSSLVILDQIRSHEDRRINSTRVVLCAASPNNRSFSFQSGADAFLVRPFHLADLVANVTEVLKRPDHERSRHRRDELLRLQ